MYVTVRLFMLRFSCGLLVKLMSWHVCDAIQQHALCHCHHVPAYIVC